MGCTDGSNPVGGLVEGSDGIFYGTTNEGGANGNYGTVFKITPQGTLTTLYSFCAQAGCTDGENPDGGLVEGSDGNFYITPQAALTTLYSFCAQAGCADGEDPIAGLLEGSDGNFYGTAENGGNNYGTVFKITPQGTLTTLYSFCPQALQRWRESWRSGRRYERVYLCDHFWRRNRRHGHGVQPCSGVVQFHGHGRAGGLLPGEKGRLQRVATFERDLVQHRRFRQVLAPSVG
jgi:uncharacterized repeat protein (TIGR03803 family)